MIPYGLNPFGLEDKTLTFHRMENGEESQTITGKSRKYCYATFPEDALNLSSEWAVESADSQETWNNAIKYTSRGGTNQWMVHEDKDFYFCTFTDTPVEPPSGEDVQITYDTCLGYTSWNGSGYQSLFSKSPGDNPPEVGWPNPYMNGFSSSVATKSSSCTWWKTQIDGAESDRHPISTSGISQNTTYYAHWKFNMDFTANNVTIVGPTAGVQYNDLFNYIPPGNYHLTVRNLMVRHSGGQNHTATIGFAYQNSRQWHSSGNFGFTVSNLTGTSGGSPLRTITSTYGPAISVDVNGKTYKIINIDCDISFQTQNNYNLWILIKGPSGCDGMALISGESTFELRNRSF